MKLSGKNLGNITRKREDVIITLKKSYVEFVHVVVGSVEFFVLALVVFLYLNVNRDRAGAFTVNDSPWS